MREGSRGRQQPAPRVAVLLCALLLLHHPLMSLTPMTLMPVPSGHGMSMVMTTPSMVGTSERSAHGTAVAGDRCACPACAMTCPLMEGVTPDRPALNPPAHSPHPGGQTACISPSAIATNQWSGHRAARLVRRAAGYYPTQRTRRALLGVYLL